MVKCESKKRKPMLKFIYLIYFTVGIYIFFRNIMKKFIFELCACVVNE
jgi:hypothetical protein